MNSTLAKKGYVISTLSLMLSFIIVFLLYYGFLYEEYSLSVKQNPQYTEIANSSFDFSFFVNDQCQVDSHWANYILTGRWSAWLKCPKEGTLIRMDVFKHGRVNNQQDTVLNFNNLSNRTKLGLNHEKKVAIIVISHPDSEREFVITATGNDFEVLKQIAENYSEK